MKTLIAVWSGPAWKLKNLTWSYDDFLLYTTPMSKLPLKHL